MKWFANEDASAANSKLKAISQTHALIEFDLDGTIRDANRNFLDVMGYELDEIRGKHHRMFVVPEERDSADYAAFWESLRQGTCHARLFRRRAADGREVWLQASYGPVLARDGKPNGVIKIATDVSERIRREQDQAGKVAAISRSQAVIEFDLDGHILDANENFLQTMGYRLDEIRGRHHRLFVDPAERDSEAYREFWASLRRGEYQTAVYKRYGKDGREVWINASYNPILDPDGRPVKVVKFATDVTARKLRNAEYEGQIAAINKSQAVIEFETDGTIIRANENFLQTVGYDLDEIRGKHHRLFVDPAERESAEYAAFWDDLRRGAFKAAEYRRIAKGGREIWIQASYNPILDPDGQPLKVIKYASDVTQQVLARKRAEHVSALMEQVAAGSQQLNSSVREIADGIVRSKDTTSEAFDLVKSADRSTQQLTEAAEAMGGIIEMINTITGQINLLALNATIESARAGDAGKGFAVVASEVKNLANQAQSATEQISTSIDGMQSITGNVVGSLNSIRGAMEQVLDYVNSSATAIEEQTAVTANMNASMQEAASEASRIGEAA